MRVIRVCAILLLQLCNQTCSVDPRNVLAGRLISYKNGYYDGLNIVAIHNSTTTVPILSVFFTHGPSCEGDPTEQLFHSRSSDLGVTWSTPTALEQIGGDKHPYAVSHDGYQLVAPALGKAGGPRIYVLYSYNLFNVTQYPNGTLLPRSDMLAGGGNGNPSMFFRFSDDLGESWSSKRYEIPIRVTKIDRDNPFQGRVVGLFNCDKPSIMSDNSVMFAYEKTFSCGYESQPSEAFFMRSPNLLHEQDPALVIWDSLPDGDTGLSNVNSRNRSNGEEVHVLQVSNSSRLLAIWRTDVGFLASSYSSDGGHSWSETEWLSYHGMSQPGSHAQVMLI